MQKSLAQAATVADEAVSQWKKLIDVKQRNDLSILVGIGREIIMMMKCILGLVCLVLVGTVYIVARLP
jgi:hypothetical protein